MTKLLQAITKYLPTFTSWLGARFHENADEQTQAARISVLEQENAALRDKLQDAETLAQQLTNESRFWRRKVILLSTYRVDSGVTWSKN